MNSVLQPTLQDAHLLLRPLQPEDFDALFAVAKDPLIWVQHPAKRYQRDVFEGFFKESLDSGGALVIIDKGSNAIIGSSRFYRVGVDDAIEIGWTFLERKYWGGAYNRRIKRLMINHAFQYLGNIIFYVDKNNLRSQKAVEKIGGVKITAAEFPGLAKTTADKLTFLLSKKDWNV